MYCKEEGIVRHNTVRHTPEQNSVAEWMNQTLLERARSMISNTGLGKELWTEAVNTACYLTNRSPSMAIKCKIPEEVWSGRTLDYSSLRVFSCEAYSHILSVESDKLDHSARKGIFMCYSDGVKGYRIYDPVTRKIT